MQYTLFNNRIEIPQNPDFCIEHILECGQVFRYKKTCVGYEVFTGKAKATIVVDNLKTIIYGNTKVFEQYFDLQTDYSKIKTQLFAYSELIPAIEYGKGIRILRQNPTEAILSFIISSNNNIPRIKQSVEKICEEFGENMGDYFAFPTINRLAKANEEFFVRAGLGYRAKYMIQTIKQLQNLSKWETSSTETLKQQLLSLSGVGPKVADCALLFGFYKTDVFPTDTWILQALNVASKANAAKTALKQTALYGNLSGYAQQYLFYWYRNSKQSTRNKTKSNFTIKLVQKN